MTNPLLDDITIRHLIQWADARESVRAVLMTSTLTNPNAPVDLFSDYDIVLALRDVHPYFEDRSWLEDFGRVLVLYRDPLRLYYGLEKFAYITQYENGLKIDFTLWPLEILPRVAADPQLPPDLDVGYAVLLDKDGLTKGLKAPTYRAYIPSPPTEAAYLTLIEVFFHEATYVAKHLWRDDFLPLKYNLDYAMKHECLRQMLEWRMEIDAHWSLKTGAYGKGLKKRIAPQVWAELESTYVGAGAEENWDALFKTIALMRTVAMEVGSHLGYRYPEALHRRVVAYLQKVRNLDRSAQTFS